MENIKKILITVLSFLVLFSISCDNEGKTGSGGAGVGGVSGGGNGGGGSSGGGVTEILTPEEGTYNIDYSTDYRTIITVKVNGDNTIQLNGSASSINYKTFADMHQTYNCKTSDWTKQSGTDYKISKNIVSESPGGNKMETTMNNAEAKWRYIDKNGVKHIELDLNYTDNDGRPFRAVALKKATK